MTELQKQKHSNQEGSDFESLRLAACSVLNPRQLSKNAFAGSVAAALLTDRGNIFTGVCIDTPCSMGFCAEHAAAAAMITSGEHRIVKLVAVTEGGIVIPPCGRCREFLCQLHERNEQCEVLLGDGSVKTLSELLPNRWN